MTETTERTPPRRVRLTFDIEESLRHDIKMEATRRRMSVREYITEIIKQGHQTRKAS